MEFNMGGAECSMRTYFEKILYLKLAETCLQGTILGLLVAANSMLFPLPKGLNGLKNEIISFKILLLIEQ